MAFGEIKLDWKGKAIEATSYRNEDFIKRKIYAILSNVFLTPE